MKLVIYSAVVFCLMCHHHLFHRHAKACGGVQAAVVGAPACGAAFFQPATTYYAATAFYAPVQPLLLTAPAYPAAYAVAAPVQRAPRRQVIRTKTVVRTGF